LQQPTQAAPPAPAPTAQPPPQASQSTAIYQTQSGLTYFSPAQPQPQVLTTPHAQRIHAPPQRRPIPILAPPDLKNKGNESDKGGADSTGNVAMPSAGSDIDDILDNMFVQRRQPQSISLKEVSQTSPLQDDKASSTSVDDGVKE
jgi:hypothetical protein